MDLEEIKIDLESMNTELASSKNKSEITMTMTMNQIPSLGAYLSGVEGTGVMSWPYGFRKCVSAY